MILQARRKRIGGNRQAQHVTLLGNVLAPLSGAARVAAELHGIMP